MGFAISAILGLLLGTAACGNLIGLEEWKEPAAGPGQGGEGGSQAGSGGAAGSGGEAGGAGGAGTSSSGTGGAGGGVIEQDLGPVCTACLTKCATELEACENDTNCKQNYRPCMREPGVCCKASGGVWAGESAQALFACLLTNCELECNTMSHCGDCLLNGPETDVDCGGDACGPCEAGQECAWDGDCESATCSVSGTCM